MHNRSRLGRRDHPHGGRPGHRVGLCTLAREERGSALTIFAVVAPVFILFLALALDVGNWFTHKRQLQNRADAGALAAGVEYQDRLTSCLGTDPVAQAAAGAVIAQMAKKYAGDPTASGPVNTEVANQGTYTVNVNANGYGALDGTDGGNPCTRRTTGDWISAPPVQWTDVKVKEANIPTFFGTFGIPVPAITARARVEVRPAESDNLFIPVGIPDPVIIKAQARFFNGCIAEGQPGHYLSLANGATKVDLFKLASQAGAPLYTTLWGPTGGGTVSLNIANLGATCIGGDVNGNGWISIGVEIRLAGLQGADIDTPTCAQLHDTSNSGAIKYVDCYSDPGMVRAWKPTNTSPIPPSITDVKLGGASVACQFDLHFTTVSPGCSGSATATMDWGNHFGSTLTHAVYTVTVGSATQTVNAPTSPNTTWSFPAAVTPAASGLGAVTLHWHWVDQNPSDRYGSPCTAADNKNNPCWGDGTLTVQRTFTGADDTTGILKLLQLSTSGVGNAATLFDSTAHDAGAVSFNLYVGLQAEFKPDTSTANALSVLRLTSSQGNQSLNCDTSNQGDDFHEFAVGCSKFYSSNTYAITDTPASPVTNNPWWQGNPHSCPAENNIWGIANDPSNPWLCVATAPGGNGLECGVAYRTGNAPGITDPNTTNNCNQNDLACNHPNRYSEFVAGTDPAGDPRVVKVFIVPFGAFKGVNGAGATTTVPLFDFGAFYITGWGAVSASKKDPCLGNGSEDSTAAGQIVGHFVKWDGPNVGPVDPNQECTLDQIRPCRVVLVR